MSRDNSDSPGIIDELQSLIRREEARLIATKVMQQRAAGVVVADEAIISEHLAFMPELADELRIVREIHQLALAARKAGTATDELRILSADELEEPLGALACEAHEPAAEQSNSPKIEGFTILNEIGRGGQAVVYRAVQESTGRRVAIKILAGGTDVESEHRTRFEREVRTLAALDHPHIVSIVDRGRTHSGAFYLAMELVEGWEFDEFAAECQTIDDHHPRMLLSAMIKVARAVQDAHEQGIIHRDLKPSNIRVDRHGEPRVLDFGLAKVAESDQLMVTTTGEWIGSLPWFSPEVASNGQRSADRQSDVYALGVVFYQAITGRFPYDVAGPLPAVLQRICKDNPASIQLGESSVRSNDLSLVLLKALAKSPGDRYADAAGLADDLEAVAHDRAPSVREKKRFGDYRRLVGFIALVALAANIAWWVWPSPTQQSPLPSMQNQFGMSLVRVPAGSFLMGSRDNDRDARRDELPHTVQLSRPFWVGKTEVTRAQYAKVMGHPLPPDEQSNLPIAGLSRDQAIAFCRRLAELEGRPYRLPTEAEWEYVCLAGGNSNTRAYLDKQAWYLANSAGKVHPVARKMANEWGVNDMLGNVEEWCIDDYAAYPAGMVVDPKVVEHSANRGVLRGGSFASGLMQTRASNRVPQFPGQKQSNAGLRVVLDDSSHAATSLVQ